MRLLKFSDFRPKILPNIKLSSYLFFYKKNGTFFRCNDELKQYDKIDLKP
jgi:hypothetical protein